MKQLTGFELLSDWIAPAKVGNTGGATVSGPAANSIWIPGSPAVFAIQGLDAWADVYQYRNIPGDWSPYTEFEYRFTVSFPSADSIAACQAVEWELQQVVNGHIFNMAWQADMAGTKMMRTFDYAASKWVPTDIPVPTIDLNTPTEVVCRYLRNAEANTITHLSFSMNGVESVLDITRPGVPTSEPDYLHCALQLDSQQVPKPYMVNFDKIGITAW